MNKVIRREYASSQEYLMELVRFYKVDWKWAEVVSTNRPEHMWAKLFSIAPNAQAARELEKKTLNKKLGGYTNVYR